MTSQRRLCQLFVCATLVTGIAAAHTETPASSPFAFNFWNLPIVRFFLPTYAQLPDPPDLTVAQASLVPACLVEPLVPVEDQQAMVFEGSVGSAGIVDVAGLTPTTAKALGRFRRIVTSAGGQFQITSAFRPGAYQAHLQSVWDKWMIELRDNEDAECQALKAEVAAEFTRHQLLESQRPVDWSDHTLGIGFDAWVKLPGRAKRRHSRLDSLARKAGVMRPNIFADPVHYRLIGSRG